MINSFCSIINCSISQNEKLVNTFQSNLDNFSEI